MSFFGLDKSKLGINGNICVHSKILNPSCKKCVEVCPNSAWVLDNRNSLLFDDEKCKGCLLCTCCPEGAIYSNFNIKAINSENGKNLFISCEKSTINSDELKIACIHSIGLKELLNFYLNEIKYIYITIGDCNNCYNPKQNIFNSFDEINKLEVDIKLFNLDKNTWENELKKVKSFHKTSLTRRDFLRSFTAKTIDTTLKATNLITEERSSFTLADIVPKLKLKILPFMINIDENKCNGCDICFKLCQHKALFISNLKYIIDSQFCTNCNLCIDMCNEEAIKIIKFQPNEIYEIELKEQVCNACGVSFHTPINFVNSLNKCQICQKINYRDKLD